jgi:electron transfer flavoprotein beta subunit
MKILVCISHVPDTTSKINFVDDATAFDKNGVQFIINPNDEFGLTRAVWFQQKQQAEVTVISVGDASCEPTLRKCLAIGANKAIRIDLNPTDGFQVAQQLNAHCKEENYNLIIAGRESIDYNGAMVPGMLSAMMEYNFVTNCMALEIENNTAKASREIDGGIESVSCQLPLVIGAQKGLVEEKDLIIPNMRGIMQARQKSLTVLPPVESQIKTSISKFEKPAPKGAVKMVPPDQIDQLIDLLHNEAKVI